MYKRTNANTLLHKALKANKVPKELTDVEVCELEHMLRDKERCRRVTVKRLHVRVKAPRT